MRHQPGRKFLLPPKRPGRKRTHRPLPKHEHLTVAEWLRQLDLEGKFDYLIVGDASGQSDSEAIGWACTILDEKLEVRFELSGGSTSAGLFEAELTPYLYGLLAIREELALHALPDSGLRVVILTDRSGLAAIGSADKAASSRQKSRALWEAFRAACGPIAIRWETKPGGTLELQDVMDTVAARRRKQVLEDLPRAVIPGEKRDVLYGADAGSQDRRSQLGEIPTRLARADRHAANL